MESEKIVDLTYKEEIVTDVENKRIDTEGKRGCGMNWEVGLTYIHY